MVVRALDCGGCWLIFPSLSEEGVDLVTLDCGVRQLIFPSLSKEGACLVNGLNI